MKMAGNEQKSVEKKGERKVISLKERRKKREKIRKAQKKVEWSPLAAAAVRDTRKYSCKIYTLKHTGTRRVFISSTLFFHSHFFLSFSHSPCECVCVCEKFTRFRSHSTQ